MMFGFEIWFYPEINSWVVVRWMGEYRWSGAVVLRRWQR